MKYLGINFKKYSERFPEWKLQNIKEINRTANNGKPSMFMDCKNKYNQNVPILQRKLHIQCDPNQNPQDFLFKSGKKMTLKFIWNHKRFWIGKVILNNKNKVGSIQ